MTEVIRYYEKLHNMLTDIDQEAEFSKRLLDTVQGIVDKLPAHANIALRPRGEFTAYFLRLINFREKNIVGIFDKSDTQVPLEGVSCYTLEQMKHLPVDVVLITSFNRHKEIVQDMLNERERGEIVDICGLLEKEGYEINAPFYKYCSGVGAHEILNFYYQAYFKSGGKDDTKLRQLLIATIEAKDFQMTLELCEKRKGMPDIPEFVFETEKLTLDLIKLIECKLKERKQKDIWLFWTDAVSYHRLEYLPGIYQLSEESVFFERTYTNTPWTHQTQRAMMSGILPIDDFESSQRLIGRDNSILLQYLEEKGYSFKMIGCDGERTRGMEDEYVINMRANTSCNMILWTALINMLDSMQPVFYILHFLAETHPPMVCPILDEISYDTDQMNIQYQMKTSYGYADRSIMFWHKLLGQRTQIFMSDHGEHLQFPQYYWSEIKIHAYCFVWDGMQKSREKRFLQLRNFYKLVQWILEKEQYPLERALEDYGVFQDVDIYSEALADMHILRGKPEYAISYRGAVTYQYKYVIDGTGREYYYRIDGEEEEIEFDNSEIGTWLKEIAGTTFLDISKLEKFNYAKRLYESICNKTAGTFQKNS